MDLFKFVPGVTTFENAAVINGVVSKMWIERFRTPGEFELKAPLSSGLREFLPIGTHISHTDTREVMTVEDHQVKEERDKDPQLTITGRSLDAFFEQRFVGANQAYNNPVPPGSEYTLAADDVAGQIVTMLRQHLLAGQVADAGDALPDIDIVTSIGSVAPIEARTMKRQTLAKALVELLEINNYGIKTVRYPMGFVSFEIHEGADRSDEVLFSWKAGELDSAEYLWTSRNDKNVAYVKGRYVEEYFYMPGVTGWDRRVLIVDGSDLDDYLDVTPSGVTLTAIRNKMYTRGEQELRAHNETNIARADISQTTRYRFRTDFDLGDIVSIEGNYGQIDERRVIEYSEIEDETGSSGHPTLEII